VAVDPTGKACVEHMREGLYAVEAGSYGSGFLKVRYYPVRISFPDDVNLFFRLPYGEVHEGGVESDAVVSGTLRDGVKPVDGVKICLFHGDKQVPALCTETNDLGQYALVVPPGTYRLEISNHNERIHVTKIELPVPGYYRDRVSLGQK